MGEAARTKPDVIERREPVSGVYAAAGVRHALSWPAVGIRPEGTVYAALDLLEAQQFNHLLVTKDGALHGMLCRCDLLDAPMRDRVADHMSRNVVWLLGDATLARARTLMDQHGIGALPVSDFGSWGIITRGDLVRAGMCERAHCVACGSSHHLRPHPLYEDELLCRDCRERHAPLRGAIARAYVDLGVGD